MLSGLRELLIEATQKDYALAAFNVFGYEDAAAVVRAAERIGAPVILATNSSALEHMPFDYIGPLLRSIAEHASVPVCVHLDHGKDAETVRTALESGYTSVMYDGSQLPLQENIDRTREVVEIGRRYGVAVEAEIGSVGYSDSSIPNRHIYSDPIETERFVEETGIDAVAVSIGTVHRMEQQIAVIDYERLNQITERVHIPLVLHGSTGVSDTDLSRLAALSFGKVNIGTALRLAFGQAVKEYIALHPESFDRLAWFKHAMPRVEEAALSKLKILGHG